MELMPFCRHCGCTLIFCDHDACYDDAVAALFSTRGYCPQCQQKYSWTAIYKLCCIDGLEEDE